MNDLIKAAEEKQLQIIKNLTNLEDEVTDIINLTEKIPGVDKQYLDIARSNISIGLAALKYAIFSIKL